MSLRSSSIIAFALLLCVSVTAQHENLEISMSPTPVGSGARAAGMANAFVAVADDATAASWNPAGLVQLERPEISFVGSWNALEEDFLTLRHREVQSSHGASSMDINYLSVAYPLKHPLLGRNIALSLSYQRKYDFSRDFNILHATSRSLATGTPLGALTGMRWDQKGGLSAISPAVAIELTERLSLGVALNLWRAFVFG